MYDAVIIGNGVAGITAAIYLKRANKKIIIIDSGPIGGAINYIPKIENYIGFDSITGPDLCERLYNQIKRLNIEYKYGKVSKIINNDIKKIITDNGEYETSNIIIASGRKPRALGLNEEKYKNIHYCALCDGAFYKDKVVAVIGGGNSAIENAIYLSNICKKVYLIHRRDTFKASQGSVDIMKSKDNIEIITNEQIKELIGDDLVQKIILNNQNIAVDGLFIYIGNIPSTDFLNGIDLNTENGYIIVNEKMETNIKGIYAAGDVIKKDFYQIATAIGEGAIAGGQIK